MDLLLLPDECIQFIVNLLPVSTYRQHVLVRNWRPSDVEDNYLNRANLILSKPSIYPLYIQNREEEGDPLMVGRLCMVSKKFYEEFTKNKYWKPLFARDIISNKPKGGWITFEEPCDGIPETPIWYNNYRKHVIVHYYKKYFKKKYINYIITELNKLIIIANHNKQVAISNYKIIGKELQKLQGKLQPIQFMSSTGYIKNRPHSEWMEGFDGVEFDTHFNGGKIYHLENQIQSLTKLQEYLDRVITT